MMRWLILAAMAMLVGGVLGIAAWGEHTIRKQRARRVERPYNGEMFE